MAGILVASGQTFVIDTMKYYIDNISNGLYVGLMTNSTLPNEGSQIGTGITELSCIGYARIHQSSWGSTAGIDPVLSGATVAFTVSGVWEDVNGYFVSLTSGKTGNADVLWAEVFPVGKRGDKNNGDKILITPIYEQRYYGEV